MGDKNKKKETENKSTTFAFERYRLTLTHEFIDDEGVSHKLDLPLTVQQVVEHHTREKYGAPVFINEMLERMKYAVLNQAEITW